MSITLPDARQLSDPILEALRLRALRGCELGYTQGDLAELLGVSRETISRWWSAYRDGGLDALPDERSGRPVGSGRTLDDSQATHLQNLIDTYSPEELEIAAPLWSRRAVHDLILKEYLIDLPIRTVGEYLKRWGYTAKRPIRHAKQQDPDEVMTWLEETYPTIEEQARQEDAEIHFGDETGVAADEHPHDAYSRKGEPAIVEVPGPHIRINVIATVTNTGAMQYMTYEGMLNGARFVEFLEHLVRTTPKKIILVVDNLTAHHSAPVWEWLEAHPDRIEIQFLPHRSPEMNPEECLNNDLKGNVHKERLPDNKSELRAQVEAFLKNVQSLPQRVMSYFQHPLTQYAAAN
jgi:transposase